ELVAAGLDGEQRGQRHVDVLKPAVFQLTLYAQAGGDGFDLHDDGRVGDAEEFGQDNAGLAEAEVVGLQAGEDKVGRLGADGVGEELGEGEGTSLGEVVGLDVDGAVGALGGGDWPSDWPNVCAGA